jgi:hypothetical protein
LPVLQREDGSFIGLDEWGDVFAVGLDGTELWSAGALGTPLYATADGGVIVTSTLCAMPVHWNGPCPYPLGTLYTLDQNGNVTSQQADQGAVGSWTGEWTVASGGVVLDVGPQFDVDDASFASQVGGNPSQNGVATPQCPCEVQSTASGDSLLASIAMGAHALSIAGTARTQPTDLLSAGATKPTDLILVGDPGPTGNIFEDAAEEEGTSLSATDTVIQGPALSYFPLPQPLFPNPLPYFQRVSSVADFAAALSNNGPITGQLFFFGHGGVDRVSGHSAIFPGMTKDAKGATVSLYNLTSNNVNQLSYPNQNLGPNSSITLFACKAGLKNPKGVSIAQEIANRLHVPVMAWKVGLFFDVDPNSPATRYYEVIGYDNFPSGIPLYPIPEGGVGKKPCVFQPNGQEPQRCGGQ